jgi:hypothetical protein
MTLIYPETTTGIQKFPRPGRPEQIPEIYRARQTMTDSRNMSGRADNDRLQKYSRPDA